MSVLYLASHNSSQKPIIMLALKIYMSPKMPSIASELLIKCQIKSFY